jgi:hypothetical protein
MRVYKTAACYAGAARYLRRRHRLIHSADERAAAAHDLRDRCLFYQSCYATLIAHVHKKNESHNRMLNIISCARPQSSMVIIFIAIARRRGMRAIAPRARRSSIPSSFRHAFAGATRHDESPRAVLRVRHTQEDTVRLG